MSKLNSILFKQRIHQLYQTSALPSLIQYIKIDNLSRSFDSQWQSNGKLDMAANHIKEWIKGLSIDGVTTQVIKDPGYSPIIFTQFQGQIQSTLFFYGHYDKQPPFQGWFEGIGATNPKIINGKLYGRGGADDGYSTYSTILALKCLKQQGVKIPRCVMITQGDEQSGSGHMKHYLESLKTRIGEPFAFFCLDSFAFDYNRLWLTTSLRGNLVATLKVTANLQGLHSGQYSGIFPSCFRIARMLLNRIQNYQTGEISSNFHTTIPPNRYRENQELAQFLGEKLFQVYPFINQTQPISKNPIESLLNRSWKPSFTVIGQTGFPQTQNAGNIILPSIDIKFTIRLPPNYQIVKAQKDLKDILLTNVPYGAKAQLLNIRASAGWSSNEYQPYFYEAIKEASQLFYGQKMISFGQGGTIPLMAMLEQLWPGRQFLITGVLGPDSNAHGPNEFLHIDYVKRLTCCLGYIVAKCSQNINSK